MYAWGSRHLTLFSYWARCCPSLHLSTTSPPPPPFSSSSSNTLFGFLKGKSLTRPFDGLWTTLSVTTPLTQTHPRRHLSWPAAQISCKSLLPSDSRNPHLMEFFFISTYISGLLPSEDFPIHLSGNITTSSLSRNRMTHVHHPFSKAFSRKLVHLWTMLISFDSCPFLYSQHYENWSGQLLSM